MYHSALVLNNRQLTLFNEARIANRHCFTYLKKYMQLHTGGKEMSWENVDKGSPNWNRISIVALSLLKQVCKEKKLCAQKVMRKADASLHRSRKNWQVGFCVLERWTRTLLLKHGEASHWLPCQVAPVRPSLPDMTGLPARPEASRRCRPLLYRIDRLQSLIPSLHAEVAPSLC